MDYQQELVFGIVLCFTMLSVIFLSFGGWEIIKSALQNVGNIISWPWRHLAQKNRNKQEWKRYLDIHKQELVENLMSMAKSEMVGNPKKREPSKEQQGRKDDAAGD